MTSLLVLRHGQTDWSRDHRIQGRTDIPLNEVGRAWLLSRRLPRQFASWTRFSSPLLRCVQTCECLGLDGPHIESRLAEMDWGRWEGRSLAELRAEQGAAMQANEDRGFDFRPEQGESPREVLARVMPWLAELAGAAESAVAVTHRGVIRVLMAHALGWDMLGRPPVKLDWNAAHLFRVDARGRLEAEALNQPLAATQA